MKEAGKDSTRQKEAYQHYVNLKNEKKKRLHRLMKTDYANPPPTWSVIAGMEVPKEKLVDQDKVMRQKYSMDNIHIEESLIPHHDYNASAMGRR